MHTRYQQLFLQLRQQLAYDNGKRVRPTTRTDIQSLAERKKMIYTRTYALIRPRRRQNLRVSYAGEPKTNKRMCGKHLQKTSKLHPQRLASKEIQIIEKRVTRPLIIFN